MEKLHKLFVNVNLNHGTNREKSGTNREKKGTNGEKSGIDLTKRQAGALINFS
jgi:hypothetical protein